MKRLLAVDKPPTCAGEWAMPPGENDDDNDPQERSSSGQQLDAIMRDMDEATAAWAAAGRRFEGPEYEAREAVFARLREWNQRNAR